MRAAASASIGLIRAADEDERRRERTEHERLLRVAQDSGDRISKATERIRRMTQIYDERLHGTRTRRSL